MTLNGHHALCYTNHQGNLKKDESILSAAKYVVQGLYFQTVSGSRRYSWGFRGEEPQTTVECNYYIASA